MFENRREIHTKSISVSSLLVAIVTNWIYGRDEKEEETEGRRQLQALKNAAPNRHENPRTLTHFRQIQNKEKHIRPISTRFLNHLTLFLFEISVASLRISESLKPPLSPLSSALSWENGRFKVQALKSPPKNGLCNLSIVCLLLAWSFAREWVTKESPWRRCGWWWLGSAGLGRDLRCLLVPFKPWLSVQIHDRYVLPDLNPLPLSNPCFRPKTLADLSIGKEMVILRFWKPYFFASVGHNYKNERFIVRNLMIKESSPLDINRTSNTGNCDKELWVLNCEKVKEKKICNQEVGLDKNFDLGLIYNNHDRNSQVLMASRAIETNVEFDSLSYMDYLLFKEFYLYILDPSLAYLTRVKIFLCLLKGSHWVEALTEICSCGEVFDHPRTYNLNIIEVHQNCRSKAWVFMNRWTVTYSYSWFQSCSIGFLLLFVEFTWSYLLAFLLIYEMTILDECKCTLIALPRPFSGVIAQTWDIVRRCETKLGWCSTMANNALELGSVSLTIWCHEHDETIEMIRIPWESSTRTENYKCGEPSSPVTETENHPEHQNAETDKIDMKYYMLKLAGIKTNFEKIKDTFLYGTIIGNQIDFDQLVKKLKLEWYWLNGDIRISPKGHKWFEIRFANPLDLKNIWASRPYYAYGQLMLLKQWKPYLDHATESKTCIDAWVRILNLPAEFVFWDILKTIMEMNKIGELIK